VQDLWDKQYKSIDIIIASTSNAIATKTTIKKLFLLADYMQHLHASKVLVKDEYQRCYTRENNSKYPNGHLAWWVSYETKYPKLAQMARDIFSIPSILAEVERLFSSAKLMILPSRNSLAIEAIEAGECIRSWVGNSLIFGDYFEYLLPLLRKREHFRLQSMDNFVYLIIHWINYPMDMALD
jgi:hypothetical protein